LTHLHKYLFRVVISNDQYLVCVLASSNRAKIAKRRIKK
jgi:hypothetical protein